MKENVRSCIWWSPSEFIILPLLTGCVRLASLGLPRGAHPGEPLTRANRTITLALSWWRHVYLRSPQVTHSTSRALGADPGEPRQSYSNVPGRASDRGRPREAKRTNPLMYLKWGLKSIEFFALFSANNLFPLLFLSIWTCSWQNKNQLYRTKPSMPKTLASL